MNHRDCQIHKLPRAWPKNRGFTLIEIMVAIFIMVVATSFMVINLGESNGKSLRQEARKIAMTINHGIDEAVLSGQVLGVQFDTEKQTYQFINVATDLANGITTDLTNSDDNTFADDDISGGDGIFTDLRDNTDDDNADGDNTKVKKDSFMRVRTMPKGISIDLNLLERKQQNQSKYTPERVREILESSILDKASDVFDDDLNKPNDTVIIEPNGLINPFTLVLRSDKESITIELGDEGSAVVIDPKNTQSEY